MTSEAMSLRRLALFCLDGLLGFRVDPPGVETDAVFRRYRRPPELVPVGDEILAGVEIRDHVIAVLQHPVERVRMRDQAGAVRRLDQLLDQFVDRRALDAEQVAAA